MENSETNENKVNFSLSKESAGILLSELNSLYSYHYNDDRIHAKNCGSKVVDEIESQINSQI